MRARPLLSLVAAVSALVPHACAADAPAIAGDGIAPRTSAADAEPAQPMVDRAARPLTLAEALDLAAGGNETAAIARARLRRAAAQLRQAQARLLPSLGANTRVDRASRSHRPFGTRPDTGASDSIGADLTLIDPSSWPAVAAARAERGAAELDAGELRRALAFSVVSSYLRVIAAEHQLDAADRRVAVAERIVAEGAARVQAGVATANDQTRKELELATAQGDRTSAELAARTDRLALGYLLGATCARPLVEPEAATLPPGDEAAVVALAQAQRADLRAADERIRALALTQRGARSGYLPTLGVSGGWSVADGDADAIGEGVPTWSAALTARWTLYDGGERLAAAEATGAAREEAAAQQAGARRQLAVDVATAAATLSASAVAVRQAEAQLRVARLNLDEVHARALQGLATGLQEADANAALFEAESALIQRRLSQSSARYELRRLVGWWPL